MMRPALSTGAVPLVGALLALLSAPSASAAALDALRSATAAAGHSLDAWCIAYSCPGQSYACAVNADCRACLTCLHFCNDSDDTCSAACLYRCRAERLLTEFLTCAVTEHNCVQLSSPGPPRTAGGEDDAECLPEQLQAWGPPAALSEIAGLWLAVRGGHPFHDCHPCRGELLEADGSVGFATGGFLFEDAAVKMRRQVLASWPENGTLQLGLTKVGQAVTEAWRLSWASEEARGERLMLSYCGSAAGAWRYRGRLELRRPKAALSASRAGGLGGHRQQQVGGFACGIRLEGEDCRRMWEQQKLLQHDANEL